MIWVTLQRAQTAREAITTLGNLMAKYGYASGGESFSIADQKEAWYDFNITLHSKECHLHSFSLHVVYICFFLLIRHVYEIVI